MRKHLPFILLMIAAVAIVFLFYLKGPDHLELKSEWFSHSNGLLRSKMTQLLQKNKYTKYPSLIDRNSNTRFIYKYN